MQLVSVHSLRQIIIPGNNYQYLTISISLVYSSHHSVPISSGLLEQTVSSWCSAAEDNSWVSPAAQRQSLFLLFVMFSSPTILTFEEWGGRDTNMRFYFQFLNAEGLMKEKLGPLGFVVLFFSFPFVSSSIKLGSPRNGYCYGLQPELEELTVSFNLIKGRGGQKSPSPVKCKHFSFSLLAFFFCETCRTNGAIWRIKVCTIWVLSLLVEFWSWYNKISLCYAAFSFTYRRAEIHRNYNHDFYQVAIFHHFH